jgi:hypothetical protein
MKIDRPRKTTPWLIQCCVAGKTDLTQGQPRGPLAAWPELPGHEHDAEKCEAVFGQHHAQTYLLGDTMPKLNAPTQVMFLVSLVIVLLAIIGLFVNIPVISMYAFWIAVLGYVVLAAACVLKGV